MRNLFKINNKLFFRNSEEEEKFVMKLMNALGNIDTTNILSKESLESIVQE